MIALYYRHLCSPLPIAPWIENESDHAHKLITRTKVIAAKILRAKEKNDPKRLLRTRWLQKLSYVKMAACKVTPQIDHTKEIISPLKKEDHTER